MLDCKLLRLLDLIVSRSHAAQETLISTASIHRIVSFQAQAHLHLGKNGEDNRQVLYYLFISILATSSFEQAPHYSLVAD